MDLGNTRQGNTQPHYKQGPLLSQTTSFQRAINNVDSTSLNHFHSQNCHHCGHCTHHNRPRKMDKNFLLDKTRLICSSSAFIQLPFIPFHSRRLKYISDDLKKGSTQKLSSPFSSKFAFNVFVINECY